MYHCKCVTSYASNSSARSYKTTSCDTRDTHDARDLHDTRDTHDPRDTYEIYPQRFDQSALLQMNAAVMNIRSEDVIDTEAISEGSTQGFRVQNVGFSAHAWGRSSRS